MTIRSIPTFPADRSLAARGTDWFLKLRRVLRAIETRRQLAEMDQRMLADIGLSRSEALEEAGRAPWDLAPRRR
jgi:uncharacterized protein YjiS (DUF1127 family)